MRKVASVATSHAKKVVKLTISVVGLGPRFNSSKCKTAAKMAVARIKLLRNKREVVVRQMRRDIALLLQSGQDATARIRVEHVIREQNVLAANELLELFCELVVARLSIIAKQRGCPADLKEGISSLIFAAPRCSEIPELAALRNIFEKKYGRDFVSAATDLRPSCGVNRMLIDKLSVRTPSGEVKLKVMKEIAKEYQVDWDTTESEKELLKPPEELIEGPRTFVNAASLPVMPSPLKSVEQNIPTTKSRCEGGIGNVQFEDTASAAEAAAESAKQAIAAAQAAAYLANKDFNQVSEATKTSISTNPGVGMHSGNSIGVFMSNDQQIMNHEGFGSWVSNDCHLSHDQTRPRHMDGEPFYRRHSCNEMKPIQTDGQNVTRGHSYNNYPSPHVDIKFDESDCDEEIEMEEPPSAVYPPPERSPPPVPSSRASLDPGPRVHPNLPDYDVLAARFEALKHRKP